MNPSRTVVVVTFSKAPLCGWMLYYAGFKRAPIIHKERGRTATHTELAEEALTWLTNDLPLDDSEPVGIRVIKAVSGSELKGVNPKLLASFEPRTTRIHGEDPEVFDYLFWKAPVASQRRKKTYAPLPTATKDITVTDEVVVAASDASFKYEREDNPATAGTGWAFEYLDAGGDVITEKGSKNYACPDYGDIMGVNTFEVYALRDALEHIFTTRELMQPSVSRVVIYSDSQFAVRLVMEQDMSAPVSLTVERIHDLIKSFAEHGISVEYMWTKGHADNKWNLMADRLASVGRQSHSTLST